MYTVKYFITLTKSIKTKSKIQSKDELQPYCHFLKIAFQCGKATPMLILRLDFFYPDVFLLLYQFLSLSFFAFIIFTYTRCSG